VCKSIMSRHPTLECDSVLVSNRSELMQGLVVGFAVLAFCYVSFRSHRAIGVLIFLIDVVVASSLPNGILLGTIGTFNITLQDVTVLACMALFFQNYSRILKARPNLMLLLSGIYFLVLFSIVRGIAEFGLQTAINEGRNILSFVAVISWLAYCDVLLRSSAQSLRNVAVIISVGLLAVETLNVFSFGLGSATDYIQLADGTSRTRRPLLSEQSIVLVACVPVLLAANFYSKAGRWSLNLLASLSFFGAILSQHRSAVVAAFVLLICLLVISKTRLFGFFLSVLIALSSLIVAFGGEATGALRQVFLNSLTSQLTLNARTGSWAQYLDNYFRSGNFLDQIFGSPFGSGWGRYEGGVSAWAEYDPHNFYVVVLLRLGALGILLISIYFIRNLRWMMKGKQSGLLAGAQLLSILSYLAFYSSAWAGLAMTRFDTAKDRNLDSMYSKNKNIET